MNPAEQNEFRACKASDQTLNEGAYGVEPPDPPAPTEEEMAAMAEACSYKPDDIAAPLACDDATQAEDILNTTSSYVIEHILRIYCRRSAKNLSSVEGLSDSYTSLEFAWRHERESIEWTVRAGASYSSTISLSGEVLPLVAKNVADALRAKSHAKLRALPAPTGT